MKCAARLRFFLEHGDVVALRHKRRIGQSGGTRADHRDALALRHSRRGEQRFAPGGAVHHAANAGAAAHLVDAGIAGKTAADRVAAAHLLYPSRLGNERAAERDEIGLALAYRALGGRRIAEATDRNHRNAHAFFHVARVIEKSGVGESHRRQHDLRRGPRAIMACGDVQRVGARRRGPDRVWRPSGKLKPPGKKSSTDSRYTTAISGTALFTARSTSSPKRARFSSVPPYSSLRRFSNGAWNWEIR